MVTVGQSSQLQINSSHTIPADTSELVMPNISSSLQNVGYIDVLHFVANFYVHNATLD